MGAELTKCAVAMDLGDSRDALPALLRRGHTYRVSERSWPGASDQELERLRQLAAGLAHGYNNLLTAMLCGAKLALENLAPDHPACPALEIASNAAERAAELTRQLMAYTGITPLVLSDVNLSGLARKVVVSYSPFLARCIQLKLNLASNIPPVEGDSSQIEQLLRALITNAVEAIGDDTAGVVSIQTSTRQTDDAPSSAGVTYALLEVSDRGCGMDDGTRSRIFEPFFSTKFTGRGLSLAAAAGIVRSHGGTIEVFSALGSGSAFRVCLPTRAPAAARLRVEESSGEDPDCR